MKSDWKVAKIALVSNENLQSRFQKARGKKVHFFFGNCHTQQYYGKGLPQQCERLVLVKHPWLRHFKAASTIIRYLARSKFYRSLVSR